MADATLDRLAMTSPFDSAPFPQGPGYRLAPWPVARLHLMGVARDVVPDPLRAWGFDSLPTMLRAQTADGRVLMRLAPEELLILREEGAPVPAFGEFSGRNLIEISHSLLGIRLEGSHAARHLAVGCPIDVHEKAFPVGMSTRTLFGKFEIIVWRRGADDFRLLVARSSFFAFLVYAGSVFPETPV